VTRLDLAALDADQRRAVLAPEGPLLLVAGPGAGKTAVLAARIGYLVTVRGLDPRAVLALAFTTAAARELLARLAAALGPRGAAVEATTFHAWGLRVVRAFAAELGYADRRLAVYGEVDAGRLLAEVAGATDPGLAERPLGELRPALERARLADGADLPDGDDRLAALARAYAARLRARAAIDYPAMLAEPLRLFRARP
jgi:DNA helicase-2/ATP-dependent DNA helicase PcrA